VIGAAEAFPTIPKLPAVRPAPKAATPWRAFRRVHGRPKSPTQVFARLLVSLLVIAPPAAEFAPPNSHV
jgi:hypothetical protein